MLLENVLLELEFCVWTVLFLAH